MGWMFAKIVLLRAGFEPATYGFLLCSQLQSTALPTELSKAHAGEQDAREPDSSKHSPA